MPPFKLLSPCLWSLVLAAAACADEPAETPPPAQLGDAGDAGDAGDGACTRCGGCPETLPVTSAMHLSGRIDYPDTPPASGPHNGRCWSDWGVQDAEVPPERWVHNLEHGGVVFLHRCVDEPCDSELGSLRELVNANRLTLLTSYAQLPTRFAVIAWGVRLLSDCLDRAAFEAFYRAHVDRAPESIDAPPAAICASVPDPLVL